MSLSKAILACAGGRKTTQIVADALKHEGPVLLTTYTRENTKNIIDTIYSHAGFWPQNLSVMTWVQFLYNQCVKPYQSFITGESRIDGITFNQPPKYLKKSDSPYFLTSGGDIYGERLSDFAVQVEELSKGKVVSRLGAIYDHLYIDEIQDMAGWDLDLIEAMMRSLKITLVGDPRQATYKTVRGPKNKTKSGQNIAKWLAELEKKGLCSVEEKSENFRCIQPICDFANGLYPEYTQSISKNLDVTGHDGIVQVSRREFDGYMKKFSPQILRWDKKADSGNFPALNIGVSKGRTFDRVLIIPTKRMLEYLRTSDPTKAGDRSKLYVAVTRARFSVAFLID